MESNDTNKTPHRIRQNPDELMAAEVWIFDLDNTLYPAASKLFDQVDWNMTRFVGELLNLEQIEARKLQKQYFREYGTTMRGRALLFRTHENTAFAVSAPQFARD